MRQRGSTLFLRFDGYGSEDEEPLRSLEALRFSSLAADPRDCPGIVPGTRVTGFKRSPAADLWVDAEVVGKRAGRHEGGKCSCRCAVGHVRCRAVAFNIRASLCAPVRQSFYCRFPIMMSASGGTSADTLMQLQGAADSGTGCCIQAGCHAAGGPRLPFAGCCFGERWVGAYKDLPDSRPRLVNRSSALLPRRRPLHSSHCSFTVQWLATADAGKRADLRIGDLCRLDARPLSQHPRYEQFRAVLEKRTAAGTAGGAAAHGAAAAGHSPEAISIPDSGDEEAGQGSKQQQGAAPPPELLLRPPAGASGPPCALCRLPVVVEGDQLLCSEDVRHEFEGKSPPLPLPLTPPPRPPLLRAARALRRCPIWVG